MRINKGGVRTPSQDLFLRELIYKLQTSTCSSAVELVDAGVQSPASLGRIGKGLSEILENCYQLVYQAGDIHLDGAVVCFAIGQLSRLLIKKQLHNQAHLENIDWSVP